MLFFYINQVIRSSYEFTKKVLTMFLNIRKLFYKCFIKQFSAVSYAKLYRNKFVQCNRVARSKTIRATIKYHQKLSEPLSKSEYKHNGPGTATSRQQTALDRQCVNRHRLIFPLHRQLSQAHPMQATSQSPHCECNIVK